MIAFIRHQSSTSSKFRPQRQKAAAACAKVLKGSSYCEIAKKYLRYFDTQWPYIRGRMERNLARRITDALGEDWLSGRAVIVKMEYDSTHKLQRGIVTLTHPTL